MLIDISRQLFGSAVGAVLLHCCQPDCFALGQQIVHDEIGADFMTVTPGIRFAGDAKGDQSRITTPEKAKEIGSDYIVVGRSITAAEDPVEAYERAMREFVNQE